MDDSLIIENPVSSGADTSASILKLLKLLHSLSVRWDEILGDTQNGDRLYKPDLVSQFVNTKLTAKLNRQLEEPLLIASNCLPTWSQDLARHYPFLFPFETRYLFVQSTSFGYSRCMNRWVPQRTNSRADRRELPLGRQQRSKLKLQSRENFLRLALTAMYKYAHKPPVLEMEYEDEVGTGLGPTLEFYANTSKEFARRKLHMWRENDANDGDEFLHVANGLFPAPLADGKSSEEEYVSSRDELILGEWIIYLGVLENLWRGVCWILELLISISIHFSSVLQRRKRMIVLRFLRSRLLIKVSAIH
jgi:E3 ubiquitin-protein ligase TRIP12